MIIIQPFSSSSWAERELVLRWPALGILSGGSSHADPVVQTIPGGLRYHVQSSQIIYPSLPVENPPNITEYQYSRLIFRQQIFVFVGVDTWHTCDRVWQYLLGIVCHPVVAGVKLQPLPRVADFLLLCKRGLLSPAAPKTTSYLCQGSKE